MDVINIKLLSCTQFVSIANYLPLDPNTGSGGYYTGPEWIMGTNGEYFLGTASYFDSTWLFSVRGSNLKGHTDSPDSPVDTNAGVRPVVTISKNEIKID